jgi:hypothetical protein
MEISMSKNDLDTQTERMLDAAMDGLTPHQALIKASLADAANSAPRVVRPFQYIDRISTGKLAEAATPKASRP